MARGGRKKETDNKMDRSKSRGGRGRKQKDEQPKDFKQIGTIMDNGNGRFIVVNNQDYKNKKTGEVFPAPGRLLFENFEDDKIYEVFTISIFGVHDNAPENILNNIVINLENEKQVEDVTDEFDE